MLIPRTLVRGSKSTPQGFLKTSSNWLERLPAGSITTWEDLTTCFLAQFFLPGRTAKLRNDILMFQQHHGESLSEASLYENESWNNPRDFAKPVKAISLTQDVPSASDRRLIELENQVQRLMEAHLAPMQPTQVNKITTSCEIYSSPYDTQYCMKNPKQAFVEYASSHTDEAGEGLVSNFMASQDARVSKFETDFKQQQSEMTNKIDTVLKAITYRLARALLSDTIKNSKLNVNTTTSVLSARSYPTEDPQCSSHPYNSINTVKKYSNESNHSYKDQPQSVTKIRTQQPKEPEKTLEDEFKDLHLNLPVLEVLAHAPMYNAILDKYVESLELGKNGSAFIQGEMPKKIEDPGLFTLPCRLGNSEPFDTLADLGAYVKDSRKLRSGGLDESNHMIAILVRESSEMEDELVIRWKMNEGYK
ncbi:MAK10-like protein [Tanacetum coccineum]